MSIAMPIRPVRYVLAFALLASEALSQGTDLGGGIITRTNVEHLAALALDVRDMHNYISEANDINSATNVYTEGYNSEAQPGEQRLSLRKLSSILASRPLKDMEPSFLYHLLGLSGHSYDVVELKDNSHYADNFVETLLASTNGANRAPEAAVILNMWMYSVYLLYNGVDKCYKRSVADNPDLVDFGGGGMDEFIALWIGKDQIPGSEEGYGLYSWTQMASSKFDTTTTGNGEADVNSRLKLLYTAGVEALNFRGACSRDNSDTIQELWNVAQRMISKASVPLVQSLIAAIVDRDSQLTKMYALAIVPQTAQCRPSVFKRLKTRLLVEGNINFSMAGDIISDLQDVYGCLGITCQDIGRYDDTFCDDETIIPIAEFTPSTDVRAPSRIDLDILQIKYLTRLESYRFAKYLYLYGRNAPLDRRAENDPHRVLSLHGMATSDLRLKANPFFSTFSDYHKNTKYSDKIVTDALDGIGQYGSRPARYRYEVIAKTIQYQIPYMFALVEMNEAERDCKPGTGGAEHAWNKAASYLIGSLEGVDRGGSPDSDDGQLLWGLANKRAFQFGTVNDDGYAEVNSELENLLYAGLGEITSKSCGNLQDSFDNIMHLMLIPIVQSTLHFAMINEGLPLDSNESSVAEAETYALSVLPDVASRDAGAANIIRGNMVPTPGYGTILVENGPQEVADAFFDALGSSSYGCEFFGATDKVDVCLAAGGTDTIHKKGAKAAAIIIGIFSGLCLVIASALLCYVRNRQQRKQLNDTPSQHPNAQGPIDEETPALLRTEKAGVERPELT